MAITEIKVSTAPATDQNSLRFGRLAETMMRMETMRTMPIGKRGRGLKFIFFLFLLLFAQDFVWAQTQPSLPLEDTLLFQEGYGRCNSSI